MDCVFCDIVKNKIKTKRYLETENVLAFYDKDPSADTHLLVVPKKHIETFLDLKKTESMLLGEMAEVAKKIINKKDISHAYKLVFNGGKYQYVPHIHWHVMGGKMKKVAI